MISRKSVITFGMVAIPIAMYTATQDNDIHFNQLHKEDNSRIRYKKTCAHCGKEISAEDIVKGYDIELEDQRVIMDVFALVDGGANTGTGGTWSKYTGPAAGASVTRKAFTLYLYTSDRDTDGDAISYHEWTFPGCKGSAVPLNFADGAFSSMKYSITSRPATGVGVIEVTKIEELPAVT